MSEGKAGASVKATAIKYIPHVSAYAENVAKKGEKQAGGNKMQVHKNSCWSFQFVTSSLSAMTPEFSFQQTISNRFWLYTFARQRTIQC